MKGRNKMPFCYRKKFFQLKNKFIVKINKFTICGNRYKRFPQVRVTKDTLTEYRIDYLATQSTDQKYPMQNKDRRLLQ